MIGIYKQPRMGIGNLGKPIVSFKQVQDFEYLVGMNVNSIVLFEASTTEQAEQGATILPRHHHIFVGTMDGELQYKPYEYDKYRIVVSTYRNIIMSIDSIG